MPPKYQTRDEFVQSYKTDNPQYANVPDDVLYSKVAEQHGDKLDSLIAENTTDPVEVPDGWVGRKPSRSVDRMEGGREYLDLLEGRRGFWEATTEINAHDMPFLGDLADATYLGKQIMRLKKLKNGEEMTDDELLGLNTYLARQKRLEDATIMGKVSDVVQGSLKFASEIGVGLATGGGALFGKAGSAATRKVAKEAADAATKRAVAGMAKRAGKEATEEFVPSAAQKLFLKGVGTKAHRKALEKQMIKNTAKRLGEGSAWDLSQSAANRGARVLVKGVETGALGVGLSFHPSMYAKHVASGQRERVRQIFETGDDDIISAMFRGWADNTIELVSEFSGEAIMEGAGLAGRAARRSLRSTRLDPAKYGRSIRDAIMEHGGKGAKDYWNRFGGGLVTEMLTRKGLTGRAQSVSEALSAVGVNNTIEEMMEERAGDFMRGFFGLEGDGAGLANAIGNAIPDWEQLTVEAIAFTVPGMATSAVQHGHGALLNRKIERAVRDPSGPLTYGPLDGGVIEAAEAARTGGKPSETQLESFRTRLRALTSDADADRIVEQMRDSESGAQVQATLLEAAERAEARDDARSKQTADVLLDEADRMETQAQLRGREPTAAETLGDAGHRAESVRAETTEAEADRIIEQRRDSESSAHVQAPEAPQVEDTTNPARPMNTSDISDRTRAADTVETLSTDLNRDQAADLDEASEAVLPEREAPEREAELPEDELDEAKVTANAMREKLAAASVEAEAPDAGATTPAPDAEAPDAGATTPAPETAAPETSTFDEVQAAIRARSAGRQGEGAPVAGDDKVTPRYVMSRLRDVLFDPDRLASLARAAGVRDPYAATTFENYPGAERARDRETDAILGASAAPYDLVHELAHVWLPLLPPADMRLIANWLIQEHGVSELEGLSNQELIARMFPADRSRTLFGKRPDGSRESISAEEMVVDAFMHYLRASGNPNSELHKLLVSGDTSTRKTYGAWARIMKDKFKIDPESPLGRAILRIFESMHRLIQAVYPYRKRMPETTRKTDRDALIYSDPEGGSSRQLKDRPELLSVFNRLMTPTDAQGFSQAELDAFNEEGVRIRDAMVEALQELHESRPPSTAKGARQGALRKFDPAEAANDIASLWQVVSMSIANRWRASEAESTEKEQTLIDAITQEGFAWLPFSGGGEGYNPLVAEWHNIKKYTSATAKRLIESEGLEITREARQEAVNLESFDKMKTATGVESEEQATTDLETIAGALAWADWSQHKAMQEEGLITGVVKKAEQEAEERGEALTATQESEVRETAARSMEDTGLETVAETEFFNAARDLFADSDTLIRKYARLFAELHPGPVTQAAVEQFRKYVVASARRDVMKRVVSSASEKKIVAVSEAIAQEDTRPVDDMGMMIDAAERLAEEEAAPEAQAAEAQEPLTVYHHSRGVGTDATLFDPDVTRLLSFANDLGNGLYVSPSETEWKDYADKPVTTQATFGDTEADIPAWARRAADKLGATIDGGTVDWSNALSEKRTLTFEVMPDRIFNWGEAIPEDRLDAALDTLGAQDKKQEIKDALANPTGNFGSSAVTAALPRGVRVEDFFIAAGYDGSQDADAGIVLYQQPQIEAQAAKAQAAEAQESDRPTNEEIDQWADLLDEATPQQRSDMLKNLRQYDTRAYNAARGAMGRLAFVALRVPGVWGDKEAMIETLPEFGMMPPGDLRSVLAAVRDEQGTNSALSDEHIEALVKGFGDTGAQFSSGLPRGTSARPQPGPFGPQPTSSSLQSPRTQPAAARSTTSRYRFSAASRQRSTPSEQEAKNDYYDADTERGRRDEAKRRREEGVARVGMSSAGPYVQLREKEENADLNWLTDEVKRQRYDKLATLPHAMTWAMFLDYFKQIGGDTHIQRLKNLKHELDDAENPLAWPARVAAYGHIIREAHTARLTPGTPDAVKQEYETLAMDAYKPAADILRIAGQTSDAGKLLFHLPGDASLRVMEAQLEASKAAFYQQHPGMLNMRTEMVKILLDREAGETLTQEELQSVLETATGEGGDTAPVSEPTTRKISDYLMDDMSKRMDQDIDAWVTAMFDKEGNPIFSGGTDMSETARNIMADLKHQLLDLDTKGEHQELLELATGKLESVLGAPGGANRAWAEGAVARMYEAWQSSIKQSLIDFAEMFALEFDVNELNVRDESVRENLARILDGTSQGEFAQKVVDMIEAEGEAASAADAGDSASDIDTAAAKLARQLGIPREPRQPHPIRDEMVKLLTGAMKNRIPDAKPSKAYSVFELIRLAVEERETGDQILQQALREVADNYGIDLEYLAEESLADAMAHAATPEDARNIEELWNVFAMNHVDLRMVENANGERELHTAFLPDRKLKTAAEEQMRILQTRMQDFATAPISRQRQMLGDLTESVMERTGLTKAQGWVVAERLHEIVRNKLANAKVNKLNASLQVPEDIKAKAGSWMHRMLDLIYAGALDENLGDREMRAKWEEEFARRFNIPHLNSATKRALRSYADQVDHEMENAFSAFETGDISAADHQLRMEMYLNSERHRRLRTNMQYTVQQLQGVSWGDLLTAMFYANALSGLSTQELNFFGTLTQLMNVMFVVPHAHRTASRARGAGGQARRTFEDQQIDVRYWDVWREALDGLVTGFRDFFPTIVKSDRLLGAPIAMDQDLGKDVRPTLELNPWTERFGDKSPLVSWLRHLDKWKYVRRVMIANDYAFSRAGAQGLLYIRLQQEAQNNNWNDEQTRVWMAMNLWGNTDYDMSTPKGRAQLEADVNAQEWGDNADWVHDKLLWVKAAHSDAESIGLKPGTFEHQARVEETLYNSLPETWREEMSIMAGRATYNLRETDPIYQDRRLTKWKHLFVQGKQSVRELTFLTPFVTIVTNVFNTSSDFIPGIGAMHLRQMRRSMDADRALQEAGERPPSDHVPYRDVDYMYLRSQVEAGYYIIGAVAMTAIAAMAMDEDDPWFWITAAGPEDPKLRNQLRETGFQEYTVKMGSVRYNYQMTPLALPFALIGSLLDEQFYNQRLEDDKQISALSTALIRSFPAMLDQTFLTTLFDFASLLTRPNETAAAQFFARTGSTFVSPNLAKQVTRFIDPRLRDADGWIQEFAQEMPAPLHLLAGKPRLNALGEPIVLGGSSILTSIPEPLLGRMPKRLGRAVSFDPNPHDEVWQLVARRKVRIPVPTDRMTLDGVRMTPEQLYEFAQKRGAILRKWIEHRIAQDAYRGFSNDVVQDDISRLSQLLARRVKAAMVSGEWDKVSDVPPDMKS